MNVVDQILSQIAELIQSDRFVDLEIDGVEIKPVPAIFDRRVEASRRAESEGI